MTFVRQHMIYIIVVLAAFASAWLADILTGSSAQAYASSNPEGLGWLISPLVRTCGQVGLVTTFIGLWLTILAYSAFMFVMMHPLRRSVHSKD